MSTLLVESLRQRIGALNTLWQRAAAEITPDALHTPVAPGALPLAFYFIHYVPSQDATISDVLLDETPLCERPGWAERTGVAGEAETGTPPEQARQAHIANLDAWRAYQTDVFARTTQALAQLTEDQLTRVIEPQLPADRASTYTALVVGVGNPLRALDALECSVYQHGLRHIGEIEFARGLLGQRGLTA